MQRTATEQPPAMMDLPTPSVFGANAKNLLLSVMNVVPVSDAIEVLQEMVEKSASTNAAIGLAGIRGTMAMPAIAAASGPAISTAVAGERLRRSSETVRNMIDRGELIAYRPPEDQTKILLPLWQFTRGGAQPWVSDLIEAYGANGWSLINFIVAPRTNLNGATYLHLLQNGASADVVKAAQRTNPD
jgi:hypothetical protein